MRESENRMIQVGWKNACESADLHRIAQVCQTTGKVRFPKGSAGFTIITKKDNRNNDLRETSLGRSGIISQSQTRPQAPKPKGQAKPNDSNDLRDPVVSSTYANHAKPLQIVARSRCA